MYSKCALTNVQTWVYVMYLGCPYAVYAIPEWLKMSQHVSGVLCAVGVDPEAAFCRHVPLGSSVAGTPFPRHPVGGFEWHC